MLDCPSDTLSLMRRDHTGGSGRLKRHNLVNLVAVAALVLGIAMLERARTGIEITSIDVGTTPVTLMRRPDAQGPVVVIAHGFAGSRQLMAAYQLTLAQAGYLTASFDFEGHGRNPVPMSGDVTAIDGTTRLLMQEMAEQMVSF